jgi:hypothetical protein
MARETYSTWAQGQDFDAVPPEYKAKLATT